MSDQITYEEEVKAESDALLAEWDRDDERRRRAKADRLAAVKVKNRRRQQDRLDRGFCGREAERRGLRTVQSVWPGAPCDVSLVFSPDPRYLIDDRGAHVIGLDGEPVFVHSPVVPDGPRSYALLGSSGKWKTVELPSPANRVTHKPQHDLEALVAAGLRVGSGKVAFDRNDAGPIDAQVPVLALARIFSLGPNGEIPSGLPAIFSLWDYQPPEPSHGTADEKLNLGIALQRQPR